MNPPDEPLAGLGYGEYTDTETQRRGIRIDVENMGKTPIHEIKVEWVYDYEAPQDATNEFAAMHGPAFAHATGGRPGKALEVGRRYSFNPAKGEAMGPFMPGARRVFLYDPDWIPEMVSIVQALSPERYRVAITMNGKEEAAIPGKVFGEFVERKFVSGE